MSKVQIVSLQVKHFDLREFSNLHVPCVPVNVCICVPVLIIEHVHVAPGEHGVFFTILKI